MNQKSLIIGIIITIVWFVGIYLFCSINEFSFSNKDLNSLGDFLAGIFAPVAFFWLILGYVQQGKQLDQNTKALEQQKNIQKKQFDAMNKSVEPRLVIENIQYVYLNNEGEDNFLIQAMFNLTNLGGVANEFYIRNNRNQAIYYLEQIDTKETKSIKIELGEFDVEINQRQQTILADIIFDFKNLYAVHIVLNYDVYYQTELESIDREEKCHIYRSS
ncbi:hypothetical protein [Acinetobacter terrestris]|uniref:hypothetical protein n=1 Tax=Acinetobacter terrestris TaxID=2529843 RepID=UPI001BE4A9B0|nr:hypothetical protein [Acinetobacter terrestris]